MSLLVIIATATALFFPASFIWTVPKITIFLGVVMFGMGMTLKIEDFKFILENPKNVLIGAIAQFTIMPLLAFLITKIFSFPPEIAVGIILVGACPGGTSSNVMTFLAKGDLALSVSMTMTTTILAPFVTPALMFFFAGEWLDISFYAMMISIFQVVFVPIFLGIFINATFGKNLKKILEYLPMISIIAIILILGGVVSVNSAKIFEVGFMILVAVVLHNILGYFLGFTLAKILKMDTAKAKAISIEVGMQNSGLATSLAMVHFGASAAIPGAIFSVWHNISGSLIANYFSKRK
ncbi:MAG: bile acid:sodium symporter family protein [Selenomonadaceae bacterium]|nr:bile acid:sodium symporter family protein [Selenomonadaceae bacterium]